MHDHGPYGYPRSPFSRRPLTVVQHHTAAGNPYGLGAFQNEDPHAHATDPKGLSINARTAIVEARRVLSRHGLEVRVVAKAPTFRPGDVLVVRFPGHPTPYTYVRGRRDWPGDGSRKTDTAMTTLWQAGQAHLIARDGKPYTDAASPAAQAGGL